MKECSCASIDKNDHTIPRHKCFNCHHLLSMASTLCWTPLQVQLLLRNTSCSTSPRGLDIMHDFKTSCTNTRRKKKNDYSSSSHSLLCGPNLPRHQIVVSAPSASNCSHGLRCQFPIKSLRHDLHAVGYCFSALLVYYTHLVSSCCVADKGLLVTSVLLYICLQGIMTTKSVSCHISLRSWN